MVASLSQTHSLSNANEILAGFDPIQMSVVLDDQFANIFTEVNSTPADYLKPIYLKQREIYKEIDMDEELKSTVDAEFNKMYMLFINHIEKTFHVKLDEDWLANHSQDIPSIALIMYGFFVLELLPNIEDSLYKAMMLQVESLNVLFEDRKNKRDASSVLFLKNTTPEIALLIANIYDVSTHVMENMTEEEFFEGLPEGYIPGDVLKKLFEDGVLVGGFMEVINELFESSPFIKSMTCFNIESKYRK